MPRPIDVIVSATAPTTQDLRLLRRGRIQGTVEDESQEAYLAGVPVVLMGSDGSEAARAVTDAAGAFGFDDLRAGAYTVRVEAPRAFGCDRPDQAVAVGPLQTVEVEFVLRLTGVVKGKVVDEDSGEPLPGVAVHLFDSNGRLVRSGVTAETGDYEFLNLPEDRYSVEVDAP